LLGSKGAGRATRDFAEQTVLEGFAWFRETGGLGPALGVRAR
jgi:hypothetical protein